MMPTTRKTLRTIALVAATGLAGAALAGCAPAGGPGESTTLTVWDYYSSSAPGWQDIMDVANDQFEEAHPGVTVQYVAQSGDATAYTQLVSSSFLSNEGPDVMMLQPGWDGVLQYTDALEPLDAYFDDDFKSQISGFADSSVDGNTFGVPNGGGAMVLMYNKDLLAQAGVADLPGNFEELTATLQQVKDAGVQPFAGGISGGGDLTVWAFSYLFPGSGTSEDATALGNGELTWDDPVVKDTLAAWVSLWTDGYYPESAKSQDIGAGYNDFLAGKGAFGILPVAAMKAAADGIGADNIGALVSMGVTEPEASYSPYGAVSVWSVPVYSNNKDLAAEYIQLVTELDVQQQLFDQLAWPPANKTVNLDSGVASDVPAIPPTLEALTQGKEAHLNAHQLLRIPVSTELKRQIQSVILGQTTLDEALAAIQAVQDTKG